MENKPTLFVCITCNADGVERRGGLGHELYNKVVDELSNVARVQPVQCLGGCEKACTVAVSAVGKCALVFTNLRPQHVADLGIYLQQYAAAPLGVTLKADRPASMRDNVLVRLPPPEWESADGRVK
jgi:predicted metal-binding protein